MEDDRLQSDGNQHNALNYLYGTAAFIVVVAGLRYAQSLVVPFLISAFLAVLCDPPLQWLQKKRVPRLLALLLVMSGAAIVILFVAAVVGASIDDFVRNIGGSGGYLEKIGERKLEMLAWLESHDIRIDEKIIKSRFDPQELMQFMTSMLARLGRVLGNALMVVTC